MFYLLTIILFLGSLSTGNAIECGNCKDLIAEPAMFTPAASDGMQTCADPVSTPCDEGVTACSTLSVTLYYETQQDSSMVDPIDVTFVQTTRSCASPNASISWYGCADHETFMTYAEEVKATVRGQDPNFTLTYKYWDGDLCFCETDNCTPGPSMVSAASRITSTALVVGSIISAFTFYVI